MFLNIKLNLLLLTFLLLYKTCIKLIIIVYHVYNTLYYNTFLYHFIKYKLTLLFTIIINYNK